MIRIGPAGIPLSCKGRTNKDGLVYTKQVLDLNAMEIQFVRGLYIMEDEEAEFMKNYADENDVELHVHAPYYINLAGSGDELDLSVENKDWLDRPSLFVFSSPSLNFLRSATALSTSALITNLISSDVVAIP